GPLKPKAAVTTAQPKAAMMPSDTRVSMFVVRLTRFFHAERWNGQAAHVTIGRATRTQTHSQPGNRHASTSASAMVASMSGTVRTVARMRRRRSEPSRTSAARWDHASSPGLWTCAPYPAFFTAARAASGSSRPVTRARSVAKFTYAVAPSMRFNDFSTRRAQAVHVIPVMSISTPPVSPVDCVELSSRTVLSLLTFVRSFLSRAARGRVRAACGRVHARLRPCPGGRVRAARGRVSGRVRLVVLVVGGDDAVSFGQLAQHVVVGRELIAEARVLVAVEAAGVPLVLFRPL